jgi:hypothetical protein
MAEAMSTPQRAQRRQDLLLAAGALRQQIGADLARLEPAADRVLLWVGAGWWLRRRWPRSSTPRVSALLTAAGTLAGGTGLAWFALRHWRWLRNALVVWRLWRQLRV